MLLRLSTFAGHMARDTPCQALTAPSSVAHFVAPQQIQATAELRGSNHTACGLGICQSSSWRLLNGTPVRFATARPLLL